MRYDTDIFREGNQLKEKLLELLAESAGVSVDELNDDTRLVADLGLTSFDLSDIVVAAEEEFGIEIPDERFPEIQTVADVLRVVGEVQDGDS